MENKKESLDGKKVVVIHDIRFKGKEKIEWNEIEQLLKEYVGKYYEIIETCEAVYIGKDFPDEFTHGKDKTVLKGPNLKAKANAAQAGQFLCLKEHNGACPILSYCFLGFASTFYEIR